MALQTLLTQIAALAQKELAPIVQDIDRKGVYPEPFMRELGKIGGYQSVGTVEEGGNGLGLTAQILAIREVGKICGATAECRRQNALSGGCVARQSIGRHGHVEHRQTPGRH